MVSGSTAEPPRPPQSDIQRSTPGPLDTPLLFQSINAPQHCLCTLRNGAKPTRGTATAALGQNVHRDLSELPCLSATSGSRSCWGQTLQLCQQLLAGRKVPPTRQAARRPSPHSRTGLSAPRLGKNSEKPSKSDGEVLGEVKSWPVSAALDCTPWAVLQSKRWDWLHMEWVLQGAVTSSDLSLHPHPPDCCL